VVQVCLKARTPTQQVCFTGNGRIESANGHRLLSIITEGEPKKIFSCTLPLGMQLVHGTRVMSSQPAVAEP